MSWTQRGLYVAVIGLVGLLVVSRMSRGMHAGLSPAASPIKGAVYATAVPIYPGAKLRDAMGGSYSAEIGGSVTYTSQSWFFQFTADTARVIEFYRQKLPSAQRQAEAEPGAAYFQWIPPNAAIGELVTVTIRAGELQIGEIVKPRS
jgi:hypothetical protein